MQTNLVADSLAVIVDLLIKKLKQPGGEELEVLYHGLLRGSGCLLEKRWNFCFHLLVLPGNDGQPAGFKPPFSILSIIRS